MDKTEAGHLATTYICVDCILNGKIIATYDFAYGVTQTPKVPLSEEALILEAKANLLTMGVARAPWNGFSFAVRYL